MVILRDSTTFIQMTDISLPFEETKTSVHSEEALRAQRFRALAKDQCALSGVSLYGIGVQNVYMSGNHIEGHFWGITNIKYYTDPNLNLGNLTEGDDYNPGGNVFVNNGNNGALYDLYNNSTADVMAQGNTWNVDVQDEESIEGVIFHKVDSPVLGLVTFMPAASQE